MPSAPFAARLNVMEHSGALPAGARRAVGRCDRRWWATTSAPLYDRLWTEPLSARLAERIVELSGPPGRLVLLAGAALPTLADALAGAGHRVVALGRQPSLAATASPAASRPTVPGPVTTGPVAPGSVMTDLVVPGSLVAGSAVAGGSVAGGSVAAGSPAAEVAAAGSGAAGAVALGSATARPSVTWLDGEIEDLGLLNGAVDLVVAVNVVHAQPRPAVTALRLAGLLTSGGRLICTGPGPRAGAVRVATAERRTGLGWGTVCAHTAGRLTVGALDALTANHRGQSLTRAVRAAADAYNLDVRWVEAPLAEQTLAVLDHVPALMPGLPSLPVLR